MPVRVWSMLLAATVFILDRLTKILIERYVSIWDTHRVIPGFFNIVHTKNRGAAFGMFSDGDSQFRTFLPSISASFCSFTMRSSNARDTHRGGAQRPVPRRTQARPTTARHRQAEPMSRMLSATSYCTTTAAFPQTAPGRISA